jgi:predicted DNA-binding ribbon-helix-helix protein
VGDPLRHGASRCHAGGRRRLSRLVKRSFSLAGHRTSVALEPEFWSALTRIAAQRAQRLSGLVASADGARDPTQPLASALRVLALRAFDPSPDPAAGAGPASEPGPGGSTGGSTGGATGGEAGGEAGGATEAGSNP